MIIFDKKLKLMTLATMSGTVNDGQQWSKQIFLDPDSLGGDFWKTKQVESLRTQTAGFTVNGFGYISGGLNNVGVPIGTHTRYSDSTDVWDTKTAFSPAKNGARGFTLSGLGYVVGGNQSSSIVCRQYNSYSNSWINTTSLNNPKGMGCSTVLNGLGYVIAGDNPTFTSTGITEQLDNILNIWTTKSPLPTPVTEPGGFSLNGYIFVGGGAPIGGSNDTAAAFKYIDTLNVWSSIKSLTSSRAQTTGYALNNFGYICNGRNNSGGVALNVMEEYNDAANLWTSKSPAPTVGLSQAPFVLNQNGYTVDGQDGSSGTTNSNYQYRNHTWYKVTGNFKNSTKTAKNLLVGTNYSGRAVTLPIQARGSSTQAWQFMESNIDSVVKFGDTYSSLTATVSANISGWVAYEIQVGIPPLLISGGSIWSKRSNAINVHRDPASFSTNGYAYVAGGYDGVVVIGLNDQYTDATDSWISKASMNTARRQVAGVSLNGFGYAINGATTPTSGNTNIVELYNDSTNAWSSKATTTTAVKNSSCSFPLNGLIYVSNGTTNTLEQFNDSTNVWATKTTGGTQRTFAAPFSLNGFGYQVCGGGTTETNQYNDAADTWATKAVCGSVNKDGVGGFYLSGGGYVVGGNNGVTFTNEVVQYNDIANLWYQRPTCGTVRASPSYLALNGSGYIGNGTTTGTVDSLEFWKMTLSEKIGLLTVTARIEE